MKIKLPAGTLDRYWNDPKNWKASVLYSCKEDPRAIVPKRNKWRGWTMNLAQPTAWLALLAILAFITIPLVYLATVGQVNTGIWFSTLAVIIFLIVIVCWIFASPRRYEEKEKKSIP